jgi:hypothetical protein
MYAGEMTAGSSESYENVSIYYNSAAERGKLCYVDVRFKSDRRFPFCSAKWEHGHGDRICYCRCLRRRMRYAKRTARVTSLSLVRCRTNDYSAPVCYGHRGVLIKLMCMN